MIRDQARELSNRLSLKSLDQALLNELHQGLGCSPFESQAILATVKETYLTQLHPTDRLRPGQMVVMAISADEPPGKPLRDCRFKPIVVTVHAGDSDDRVRQEGGGRQGIAALRHMQLQRMAWEAVAQDTYLTVEDLAHRILNCGVRTIEADLAHLRRQGIEVPLRGQQLDMGRGISHKAKAVELYIQRYAYSQIQRRIRHSSAAIKRYISDFVAVVVMTAAGRPLFEISFLRQISPALVREYQGLYDRYNCNEHRSRLAEIIAQFRDGASAPAAEAEKGDVRC
jgi:hypothetical protein